MLQTASQCQNELLQTLFLLPRLFLLVLPPNLGFTSKPWLRFDLCLTDAGRCFVGKSTSSPFNCTFPQGILNH